MTTKIKWRLANRPTPDEVERLFKSALLTKDEAREILFSLENDEDRDKKSLQDEIKFLRQIIQNLSTATTIVKTVRDLNTPWISQQQWYQPYQVYCANLSDTQSGLAYSGLSNTANALYTTTTGSSTGTITLNTMQASAPDFTDIQTF